MRTFSTFISAATDPSLLRYIYLNSAIETQFEHSNVQSPLGERTLRFYNDYNPHNLHGKSFQEAFTLSWASNRDSSHYSSWVQRCSIWVHGSTHHSRQSPVSKSFGAFAIQLPGLKLKLSLESPHKHFAIVAKYVEILVCVSPRTPFSTYQAHVWSEVSHSTVLSWCLHQSPDFERPSLQDPTVISINNER